MLGVCSEMRNIWSNKTGASAHFEVQRGCKHAKMLAIAARVFRTCTRFVASGRNCASTDDSDPQPVRPQILQAWGSSSSEELLTALLRCSELASAPCCNRLLAMCTCALPGGPDSRRGVSPSRRRFLPAGMIGMLSDVMMIRVLLD